MINLILVSLIIFPVSAPIEREHGFLSQFAKSPTDGTLHYRVHESMEVKDYDYDGYIAVADCDKIGQEAMLRIEYDDYVSPWLFVAVFDCSGHTSTTAWMARDRIIAEADYYTARDHGFLGRGGIGGTIIWMKNGSK